MDNGRFDDPHSCAATREAIEHLPVDALYSNFPRAFRAYERKVC